MEPELLYHGSAIPNLTKLVPNKALGGDNPREFELDTAIYATYPKSAAIGFSLIKAHLSEPRTNGKYHMGVRWHEHSVDLEITHNVSEHLNSLKGYLYTIRNSEDWIRDRQQWKSNSSVDILSSQEVSIEDFKKEGGNIVVVSAK